MSLKFSIPLLFILALISCSDNDDTVAENPNPHNLQELGLTPNNTYPFWPDTNQFMGSNQWYDYKRGDTLVVYRRDEVTDDSGDHLEFSFLVKKGTWIVPLNVKRISFDAYILPPRFNQLMFDKPIVNFKLQKYEEDKVLACEIETPNGDFYLERTITDRMWIKLDD